MTSSLILYRLVKICLFPPKNIAFVSVSPSSTQSWQWFWHDPTSVTLRLPTDKQLIYRETLRQVCDQRTVVIAVGVALRTQLYSHKTMNGLRQRFSFNYTERQRNLKKTKQNRTVSKIVANHTTIFLYWASFLSSGQRQNLYLLFEVTLIKFIITNSQTLVKQPQTIDYPAY